MKKILLSVLVLVVLLCTIVKSPAPSSGGGGGGGSVSFASIAAMSTNAAAGGNIVTNRDTRALVFNGTNGFISFAGRTNNTTLQGETTNNSIDVAIGPSAFTFGVSVAGYGGVAIGHNAQAGKGGEAIGDGAYTGVAGTAIGQSALANIMGSGDSIVIGDNSIASNTDEVVIGPQAKSGFQHAVAVGFFTLVTGDGGIAIGQSANAVNGIAVGVNASSTASGGISIGTFSQDALESVVIGAFAGNSLGSQVNTGPNSVCIGSQSAAGGVGSVAIGGDDDNAANPAYVPSGWTDTVELGRGTASLTNGLNFRGFPVVDGNGKLATTTLTNNVIKGATFGTNAFVYTVPSGVTNNYEACGFVNVTALSVDVINAQVLFTDETGTSQTLALDSNISTTGYNIISSQGFRAKGGTTITMRGNLVTGTGSITYNIGGWLKLAQ